MNISYQKLSHTVWFCKYHIVFCTKYRYDILIGKLEVYVRNELYKLIGQKDQMQIEEINIQENHVHLILAIPPKYSLSEIMGWLKGKLAIKMYQEQREFTQKHWGRHIWARGYCVSTVGLNEDQIKKYVKWSQERESRG